MWWWFLSETRSEPLSVSYGVGNTCDLDALGVVGVEVNDRKSLQLDFLLRELKLCGLIL